jgi:anti-sigma B factor antagonist
MRTADDSTAGLRDLTGRPVEIATHRDADSVTIAVSGEVDLSIAEKLDAAICDAEATEARKIVMDLSGLTYLDSTALSVLLNASRRSRENGRRLRFIRSGHESVERLIELTVTGEMFN